MLERKRLVDETECILILPSCTPGAAYPILRSKRSIHSHSAVNLKNDMMLQIRNPIAEGRGYPLNRPSGILFPTPTFLVGYFTSHVMVATTYEAFDRVVRLLTSA